LQGHDDGGLSSLWRGFGLALWQPSRGNHLRGSALAAKDANAAPTWITDALNALNVVEAAW
jgi:hypothetical protein